MIYTIGHSSHAIEGFIALLKNAGVEALADIRSVPMSRFNPQFRQKDLKQALESAGLRYLYMGKALGGHPRAPEPEFRKGLEELKTAAAVQRVAIMCAEKEPLNCHRTLLVARALAEEGVAIAHIMPGKILPHEELEEDLLRWMKVEEDLLKSRPERLAEAYEKRRSVRDYKRKH